MSFRDPREALLILDHALRHRLPEAGLGPVLASARALVQEIAVRLRHSENGTSAASPATGGTDAIVSREFDVLRALVREALMLADELGLGAAALYLNETLIELGDEGLPPPGWH